jgi:hypothetical protein
MYKNRPRAAGRRPPMRAVLWGESGRLHGAPGEEGGKGVWAMAERTEDGGTGEGRKGQGLGGRPPVPQ